MPRGTHPLQFRSPDGSDWEGDGIVNVARQPVAFRYALGHRDRHLRARIAGWVLFGGGLGAVLIAGSGLFLLANDGGGPASQTNSLVAQAFVGLGAALVGIGVLAIFRPEVQPGTGLQWELPRSVPPTEHTTSTGSH